MIKIPVIPITIPIEYKKITKADFDTSIFKVNKHKILPAANGYIDHNEIIKTEGNIEDSNLIVLNISLGLGKSHSLIKLAEEHLKNPENIIVLIAPFKSLLNQYENDIITSTGLSKNNILNIEEISKTSSSYNFNDYKIHLLTPQAILSIGLEDSPMPSVNRQKYFNDLSVYCDSNNKKLILIFDELHTSIELFDEEQLRKLWRFKNIIKKIYTASATYNEISKIILTYLAELTCNKISIYENIRTQKTDLSKLHLHILSNNKEKAYSLVIDKILKTAPKKIDILVPTISLSKIIFNDISTKSIYNKTDLNLTTSKGKKYNHSLNNIGTTFTTGNNILHNKHCLIIILPSKNTVKNIFSNDGYSTLLQAIGRQRLKGEVHIIMDNLIIPDVSSISKQFDTTIQTIEGTGLTKGYCKISDINNELSILEQLFDDWNNIFEQAIVSSYLLSRSHVAKNILDDAHFYKFAMKYGNQFLKSKFFSGNIDAFILWSAFFNQFTTCKIVDISIYEKQFKLSTHFDIEKSIKDVLKEETSNNQLYETNQQLLIENLEKIFENVSFYKDGIKMSLHKVVELARHIINNTSSSGLKLNKDGSINQIDAYKSNLNLLNKKSTVINGYVVIPSEMNLNYSSSKEFDELKLLTKNKLEELAIERTYSGITTEVILKKDLMTKFNNIFNEASSKIIKEYIKSNNLIEMSSEKCFNLLLDHCLHEMGFELKRIGREKTEYFQREGRQKK